MNSADENAIEGKPPRGEDPSAGSGFVEFFTKRHPGCSIALLLLIFIVLLVLGWVRWNERRLEKMLADIAARGEPSCELDLLGDAVEPELDAGPLYIKASALSMQAEFAVPEKSRALGAEGKPWHPGYGKDWTEEQCAEVRQFAKRKDVGDALELIKQAAERPYCRFPTSVDREGYLRHDAWTTRGCARLVAMRMRVHVMNGEPDAALAWAPAGFHIARLTDQNMTFTSAGTACSCFWLIYEATEGVLQEYDASAARLRNIEGFLSKRLLSKTYADRQREDRIVFLNALSVLQSKKTRVRKALERPILVMNVIYYLESTDRAIAASQLSPTEARKALRSLNQEEYQRCRRLDKLPMDAYTLTPLTMTAGVYDMFLKHDAIRDSMRIAIAIKLYSMEKGRRPGSLSELTAEFLTPPLPKDPFTGNDYLVLYKDGMIIVYSVGENGKDDGGWIEDREVTENGKTKTERRRDIGTRIKE